MAKAVVQGARRHAISYRVMRVLLCPFFAYAFRFRADRQPRLPPPYLVISNHVTEYDFILAGRSFSRPMYFVIGEALYRSRWLAAFLRFFFSPIPKRKGRADMGTAMGLLRRLQAGKNVCLFAEGNTTFDGLTGEIPPTTGALVRASGAGLVTYRIEGGYFSLPRWGHTLRRGKARGSVVKEYAPEELGAMSPGEISAAIARDIYTDAYARQEEKPVAYRGRRAAEGLENALYLCPACGGIGTLRGLGDKLSCACGLKARYTEFGYLEGSVPFRSVRDWALWQKRQLRERLEQAPGGTALLDEGETLRLLEGGHRFRTVASGALRMDAEELSVGDFRLPVEEISGMAIFRKNTLQFTDIRGNSYELEPRRARSALKYRDLYQILREKKD